MENNAASATPKRVASSSPRLPYSATLGHEIAAGRNPVGVAPNRRPRFPKVAEYSNLGLRDAIPLGLPVRMES